MPTEELDLEELDESDLAEIVKELQEEVKKLRERNEKLDQFVQENVIRYWSWDKVKKEFDSFENVQDAQAFLLKILRDKAICGNKDCPAFPILDGIDELVFELGWNYDQAFDLKTAELKFKNRQEKLISFRKEYKSVKHALMVGFQEIRTIGIPNESKKDNFFEIRDFLHNKHIDLIDHCDDAHIEINPSQSIDQALEADNQMVRSEDFGDYGPDVFNERRKELDSKRKRQQEEAKKLKKDQDIVESTPERKQLKGGKNRVKK